MFGTSKKVTKEVWWLIVFTGVMSILFGLVTLFWPKLTLATLIYLYAIFVVAAGAVGLFESISSIKKDPLWWLALLYSLFNLGIGVYLLRNPEVAAAIFVLLIVVLVFMQALFDLVVASYLGKGDNRWVWAVSGVLGLIAGVVILTYPLATSVAFVWVLGLYSLIHGVVSVSFAMQVRGEMKKILKK